MGDPLDEVLMEKEALFGALKYIAKGGAKVVRDQHAQDAFGGEIAKQVGSTAVSFGLLASIPATRKIYQAVNKRRDYREMMQTYPELQEAKDEDPKFFNTAYTSLRRVHPDFGSDPLVAGSLMTKMLDNKATAGAVLMSTTKPRDPFTHTPLSVSPELAIGLNSKYVPERTEMLEYGGAKFPTHHDAFTKWESPTTPRGGAKLR